MTVPTDSFSSCSKVKLEVSHHKSLDGGDWQSTKPLVFLLDEIADEKVKKQKKKTSQISAKNFGSFCNVTTLKASPHISIAWRCRLLGLTL